MNNQILLVYEIGKFPDFQNISRKFILKNFSIFEFPTLKLGAVRVLSGVANLASKSQFSYPCSFRDMKFFYDFFKKNLKT